MDLLDPELMASVAGIGLSPRRGIEGPVAGKHRSPLHGLSPEFADFRNYTPGDDPRTLDWKLLARSDRLYVRRYEEESNLRAFLVIDDSNSMAYRPAGGGRSKYETAAATAVALGSALLRQRDAFGLMLAGTVLRTELRPAGSPGQLTQLAERLREVQPRGETDLLGTLAAAADQAPRRSLLVVLSDFLTPLDDLDQTLGRVRHRGHDLIAVHTLAKDEVDLPFDDSVVFIDAEGDEELFAEPWAFRAAYAEAIADFRETLRLRLSAAGFDLWTVMSEDDLRVRLPHCLHERRARAA